MNPLARFLNSIAERGLERMGRYYSCYRGFVIDNADPDAHQRVKLKVPQVYGNDPMDYWAWPKGIFSGNGYGMQCVPQKGEMVWVEFEFGDPKKPIYSYGHHAETPGGVNEKPLALRNIQNFWFKTPGGRLVEFDDEAGEIRITSEGGATTIEPTLLGDTSVKVLEELLDEITKITVPTPSGTSGVPINILALQAIKAKLDTLKSKVIKIN